LANCVSRLSQTFSKASSDPFFTPKRFIAMNILLSFLMHRAVFAPRAGVLTAARWLFLPGDLTLTSDELYFSSVVMENPELQ
jgi:hypothetical protein